jgi:hypothetical protein
MNRKQRRKLEKQIPKHPVNNNPEQLPEEFVNLIKSVNNGSVNPPITGLHSANPHDMSTKQANDLMYCMLGLPCKVLVESKKFTDDQIEQIINYIIDEHDSVFSDYLTYSDVQQVILEEGGIDLSEIAIQAEVNPTDPKIQNFMAVIGVAVMTVMDKCGFQKDQLSEFAKSLLHEYKYYLRGYISNYQLIKLLKDHAKAQIMLKEEES